MLFVNEEGLKRPLFAQVRKRAAYWKRKPFSLLYAGVLALAALMCVLYFVSNIYASPFENHNDHKLAPSLSLLKGYAAYYPETGGPVLSSLYGPVTVIAYLPAVLFKSPSSTIRVATFLTQTYFLLPAVMLAITLAGKCLVRISACVAAAVVSLMTLALLHSSLLAAFSVPHGDAPALGFGAFACFFLLRSREKRLRLGDLSLGAIAAAGCVLSKQNMAPLPILLCIWLLARAGWLKSIQFAAIFIAVALVSVSLTTHFLGSPAAVWLNLVTIPTHQPYRRFLIFPTMALLGYQAMVLASVPIFILAEWIANNKFSFRSITQDLPLVLPLFCGAGLAATSILGYIKAGGSTNALSPSLYFLAIAFASQMIRAICDPAGFARLASLPLKIVPPVVMGFAVAVQFPQTFYSLFHLPKSRECQMENVFQYSQAHPGQIYFPDFPTTILLSEGRLYHFAWGLQDRAQAGLPVGSAEFLRFTPPTSVMALVPLEASWDAAIQAHCGRILHPDFESELPGFSFCSVKDRETTSSTLSPSNPAR